MKRTLAVLCAVMLAGCGADAAGSGSSTVQPVDNQPAPTHAVRTTAPEPAGLGNLPDMAIVSTDGRVAVIRNGSMSATATGLVAADGSTLVSTERDSSAASPSTTLTWTGLGDGVVAAHVSLGGDLTAIATDPSAKVVALTEPNPVDPASTEIVIATPTGEVFRRAYTSELLPEGFSNIYMTGGNIPAGLFVVEYLDPPPTAAGAPRRYRVRVLDTASGELGLPGNLRDKSQTVDEQMLGFGRTHVLSPLNGLLFTLYRGIDADEANYAFVHTLGFVNGVWCLDLPTELDLAKLPGAIALVAHENRLLVASANGTMTEFVINDITDSSHDPAPRRTVAVWPGAANASGPALASTGQQVLAGQDGMLRWIDAASLTVTTALAWDMQIEAVALTANGDAIAAGTRRISEITPAGDLLSEAALPFGKVPVARIVLLHSL